MPPYGYSRASLTLNSRALAGNYPLFESVKMTVWLEVSSSVHRGRALGSGSIQLGFPITHFLH
jgi:hypothetical protein